MYDGGFGDPLAQRVLGADSLERADGVGGDAVDGVVFGGVYAALAVDAVAAAAGLAMGEGAEGVPAAVVRGLALRGPEQSARAIVRADDEDLFR